MSWTKDVNGLFVYEWVFTGIIFGVIVVQTIVKYLL